MNLLIPVDRSLLIALAVKFGLYAAWGLSALFTGIIPIRDIAGHEFELVWTVLVAVLSAAMTALLIGQAASRRKMWELSQVPVVWGWLCTVSAYPVALIVRHFTGELNSLHLIPLALGYLVIPTWWLSFLIRKNPRK